MAPSSHRRTRRAFSQNFLADPAAVRRFVDAAEIKPDHLVYEVGAGRGQLTRHLVPPARRVVAYEVDPAQAAAIRWGEVRVADFLRARPPDEPFAVVGNIPYALTAAVVEWCLDAPALTTATLLTQLEYARKRTGDFGRWSRLTISSWPWFEWTLAGRIPRTAFRPVPGVDSGILRLTQRELPLVPSYADWSAFVDRGFTGVGGSLHSTLSRHYGTRRVTAAFRATRLAQDVPVGLIYPEQWLTLYRLIRR